MQVSPAIQVWNEDALVYVPFLGAGTIPATQGFMVEVLNPGVFNIAVNNAMRTHTGANMYYKTEITNILTLLATGSNGYSDKTMIHFNVNATSGFDRDWDAHKLLSTASVVPQIYTTTGAEMYSINGLNDAKEVPMAFTSGTSGAYTISAIETSEFTEVYLQDLIAGDVTDLLTSSYTFEYTAGSNADRFIIHFGPLGINDNLMNSVSIWSSDNSIYVSVPKGLQGTISVFNMMGQEVTSTDTQTGLNVLPMENINTYYVVKVLSSSSSVTGKVYIK
jgi:predicted RecA/RadA family phage recombinase